jgi:hypothetical protein
LTAIDVASPGPPARVFFLDAWRTSRADRDRDAALDHEWDALVAAADDAWTWRDPESIESLAVRLVRLQARVLEEWGCRVRNGSSYARPGRVNRPRPPRAG